MTLDTEDAVAGCADRTEPFDNRDVPAHSSSGAACQPARLPARLDQPRQSGDCRRPRPHLYGHPPGAGKTVIASVLIAVPVPRGEPAVFVAHRCELIEQ